MLFTEEKKKDGYQYRTEDVFGTATIESDNKLSGEILDDIIYAMLEKAGVSAETVKGGIETPKGNITFTLDKAPAWEDICENTPTSTKTQEKESILTHLLRMIGINYLKRFVAAFRQAWRRM